MAASASLSNPFSLSNPKLLPTPPSRPTKILSFELSCKQHSLNPGKPIPRTVFSSPFPADSLKETGNSRFFSHLNRRSSFLRPSVSSQHQTYTDDGPETHENEEGRKPSFSLKSVILAYKEAILLGDVKTMQEIEQLITIVEKDKNELTQKVSAMSAEISTGKEKYLRLQADFDNYRKRSEKEKLTVRSDAQGEVIESLLPMVDSFERAKQQIKPETEMEKKIDTSYQGIYKQFVEIMRSLRVAVVPTVGKPFDPAIHEAIAREESQEYKEGIIIQEFCRGFKLGDRLLRPAMVKVSSGPGKKKPPSVPQGSSDEVASVTGIENR